MSTLTPVLAIAHRDIMKFLRDPVRIISTFIFPVIFIGILGGSLQAGLSEAAGYSLLVFVFTGVLSQTLFQSSALGIISLVADRESDFSQEIFVSPISRYAIILGKIIGESAISLIQGIGILIFGFIIGAPLGLTLILSLVPPAIVACLLGGAFGVLVLSNLQNQRAANQAFPFIMFPQFFLAGIFSPIKELPLYLDILSRITPMRYAVDLFRGIYYAGRPEYSKIVLASPLTNLLIIAGMFGIFLLIGTARFVKAERNR